MYTYIWVTVLQYIPKVFSMKLIYICISHHISLLLFFIYIYMIRITFTWPNTADPAINIARSLFSRFNVMLLLYCRLGTLAPKQHCSCMWIAPHSSLTHWSLYKIVNILQIDFQWSSFKTIVISCFKFQRSLFQWTTIARNTSGNIYDTIWRH